MRSLKYKQIPTCYIKSIPFNFLWKEYESGNLLLVNFNKILSLLTNYERDIAAISVSNINCYTKELDRRIRLIDIIADYYEKVLLKNIVDKYRSSVHNIMKSIYRKNIRKFNEQKFQFENNTPIGLRGINN